MSGSQSLPSAAAPVIRFISLSDSKRDDDSRLALTGNGTTAERRDFSPSEYQHSFLLYLSRAIRFEESVQLVVKWSEPSSRNTRTIGLGGVSCSPTQVRKRAFFHQINYCDTGNCLSAGRSVISLIGLPVSQEDQSLLCIARQSEDLLTVQIDGHSFELIDEQKYFSFATATPVLVLTPDILSVSFVRPDSPSVALEPITTSGDSIIPNGGPAIQPADPPVATNGITRTPSPPAPLVKLPIHMTQNGDYDSQSGFRFVVPASATSLIGSEDNCLIKRKSVTTNRELVIAHLNHPLDVDGKLVMKIEKKTNNENCPASLQLGFTLCDLTTNKKIDKHGQSSCGNGRICRNICSQAIAGCTTGTVLTVQRSNSMIKIVLSKDKDKRIFPFKFNTGEKGGETYANPNRVFFPFVALNGCADVLRIMDTLSAPVCPEIDWESLRVPSPVSTPSRPVEEIRKPFRVPLVPRHSPTPEPVAPVVPVVQKEEPVTQFEFMPTPYPNTSIQISSRRSKARCSDTPGPRIVYLNQTFRVGQSIMLKTIENPDDERSKYSYLFGLTDCSKEQILRDEHHVMKACSKLTPCAGISLLVEMWNFSKVGNMCRISFNGRKVLIDDPLYMWRKQFQKSIPPQMDDRDLYPFLVLDSDVTAVEIMPFTTDGPTTPFTSAPANASSLRRTSVLNDDGMKEVADSLLQTLDPPSTSKSNAVPLKPIQETVTPKTNGPAKLRKVDPIPLIVPEFTFLRPSYQWENIVDSIDGRSVSRNSVTGARVAYLDHELAAGSILCLKVDSDNEYLHQKKHTFNFGLTTCDPDAIIRHDNHRSGICSDCGGDFCTRPVSAEAHAGSFVSFRKNGLEVVIEITSPCVGRIEVMPIPYHMGDTSVYPFIELSGNADSVSIVDSDSIPKPLIKPVVEKKVVATTSASPLVLREPAVSVPHSSPAVASGDQRNGSKPGLEFMVLPYIHQSIVFSKGNTCVKRTKINGSMHVFFNRKIELGEIFTLKATPGAGPPKDWRFEFGFTTCDINAITGNYNGNKWHFINACTRDSCPDAWQKDVVIKYETEFASSVRIGRHYDRFSFEVGSKYSRKIFAKHFGPGKSGPKHEWFAFVRLNGDVEGLEITDVSFKFQNTLPDDSPVARPESPFGAVNPHRVAIPSAPNSRDHSESRVNPARVANLRPTSRAFVDTDTVSNERQTSRLQTIPKAIPDQKAEPAAKIEKIATPIKAQEQKQVTEPKVTPVPKPVTVKSNPAPAAPEATPQSFPKRRWFTNSVVKFEDNLITRVDDAADSRSYIFSTKLHVGEEIGFTAVRTKGVIEKTMRLVFGVTTRGLLQLDVPSLPVDACLLSRREYGAEFFVSSNLVSCIGVWDGLILRRTHSGISLVLDESESEIISLDPGLTVHPFFQLFGCSVRIHSSP